jgi:chemotaxis protein MotB
MLGILAVAMMGSGCVAQREVDEYRNLYRKSEAQRLDLQARLEEAEARIAALQAAAGTDAQMREKLIAALAERDRLAAALADAEARLRNAGSSAMLPPELDKALMELAAANPDLMEYDPRLGMVRFRSDLTFALGSTEIQARARDGLAKFAAIARTPAATGYEIRIVGHTDNVPIRNVRDKHPTNWHLSVHRSIAVKDVLEQAGLQPQRMSVAGYGEYHPIVANGPRGAEQNRRVELYLVASAYAAPTGSVAPAAPSAPAPAPEAPEMFK